MLKYFFITLFAFVFSFALFAENKIVSSENSRTVYSENGLNYDIKKVSVENNGDSLKIAIKFNGIPVIRKKDRIVVLIDDTKIGGKTPTEYRDRNGRSPATYTKVDGSVDFYGYHCPDTQGSKGSAWKISESWKKTETDYVYTLNSDTIEYTIPMEYIADGKRKAAASDTFRIIVFISDFWEGYEDPMDNGTIHVKDVVPAKGVAISKTRSESDTIIVNFNNCLIVE